MWWLGSARTGPTTGARAQLGWFGTLFAMALVFHYSDSQPLAVLPALLAGLPVLLFPGSVVAVGLAVAAGATVAVLNLPATSNHLVLSLLVAFALGAAAVSALRGRGGFAERWLEVARTPAGLVLLVVYLFTVFDKMNRAYFTPATSCGGELLGQLFWLNGFDDVVPSPGVTQVAAVAAVVAEAVILGLLAISRLRYWGVLLGVGFHAVLALASFYDFATVVFAVYVLLVPTEVFAPGDRQVRNAAPFGVARRLALAGFTAHVLLSLAANSADSPAGPLGLPWHTLLVATWFVAVLPFMIALVRSYRAVQAAGVRPPAWRLHPVVLILVPALAFLNGLTPYLGLKTVANYSMFSNLHTEDGTTNHLLPSVTALEVTDYLRDTVTVVGLEFPEGPDTDPGRQVRWLSEDPPVRIPWLELRRTVLRWQAAGITGIRLAYLRDGVRRVVGDATADPALTAPLPWWQRHLLAFRAVDSGWGPDACRW